MKFGRYGFAKFGWFRTLYPSKRSSMFSLSVSCVLLKREKSNWRKCGPSSELRPSFPKCMELMQLGPIPDAVQFAPVVGLIRMQFWAAVPMPSRVQGTANEESCRKLFG